MQRICLVIALFPLTLLFACQREPLQESKTITENATPTVVVVNYPLEFIVESLAGPDVNVLNPVPVDADPETWFPDDAMVLKIQQADLIITNGADFADWVKKLSLPRSKVLRTSLSLKDVLITVPDFVVHSHGTGGAHSHAGTVAFFWLDPDLMARQADAIAQKLIVLLPQEKAKIIANLKNLQNSLVPLSQKLDQIRIDYPGLHWFSQRPVYQYLARRTDGTVHHLHWKKNTEPDESAWTKLKTMREQQNIDLMFWEQRPKEKVLTELQRRGVASFVLDPLAVKPEQGDYLTEMQRQLNQLEAFLKQHKSSSKPVGK